MPKCSMIPAHEPIEKQSKSITRMKSTTLHLIEAVCVSAQPRCRDIDCTTKTLITCKNVLAHGDGLASRLPIHEAVVILRRNRLLLFFLLFLISHIAATLATISASVNRGTWVILMLSSGCRSLVFRKYLALWLLTQFVRGSWLQFRACFRCGGRHCHDALCSWHFQGAGYFFNLSAHINFNMVIIESKV